MCGKIRLVWPSLIRAGRQRICRQCSSREAFKKIARPKRNASCHPDREHESRSLCRNCYAKWRRVRNPVHAKEIALKSYLNRKLLAIEILGSKCVRCGFSDHRALQIDHINGNGAAERNRKNGPNKIYQRVRKGNTTGLQLLCANCNWIKKWENGENSGVYNKFNIGPPAPNEVGEFGGVLGGF